MNPPLEDGSNDGLDELARIVDAQNDSVAQLRKDLKESYPTREDLEETRQQVERKRHRATVLFTAALVVVAISLGVVFFGLYQLKDLPRLSKENHDSLTILKNATSPESQAAQQKATANAVMAIDCKFKADLDKFHRDILDDFDRPVPAPAPLPTGCTELGVDVIP